MAALERGEERSHLVFGQVVGGAALPAHEVVMVAGDLAQQVRGLVARQYDLLDDPGVLEGLQRAEHRRSADPSAAASDGLVELRGAQRPPGLFEDPGDQVALRRDPLTRCQDAVTDRVARHVATVSQLRFIGTSRDLTDGFP